MHTRTYGQMFVPPHARVYKRTRTQPARSKQHVTIHSTATRTCAYARVASSTGTTCSPVGLRRRGRALLDERIERPGVYTVIRCHWTPLAGRRVTDVVRRLCVVVVTPDGS